MVTLRLPGRELPLQAGEFCSIALSRVQVSRRGLQFAQTLLLVAKRVQGFFFFPQERDLGFELCRSEVPHSPEKCHDDQEEHWDRASHRS